MLALGVSEWSLRSLAARAPMMGFRRQPKPGKYPLHFSPFVLSGCPDGSALPLSYRCVTHCAMFMALRILVARRSSFVCPLSPGRDDYHGDNHVSVVTKHSAVRDIRKDLKDIREAYVQTFASTYFDELEPHEHAARYVRWPPV